MASQSRSCSASRFLLGAACLVMLLLASRPALAGEGAESTATPTPVLPLEKDIVFGSRPIMPSARASATFSPEVFLSHIYYLASDELEGRGVGTVGIDRAAQYIADQFASNGIAPAGDNGTYFQHFDIETGADMGSATTLDIRGVSGAGELEPGVDYIPFAWSGQESFDAVVVFVGYGQVDEDAGYDDFDGVDVRDKVVLMLRREPKSWSIDGRPSRRAWFTNKIGNAVEENVAAVLIVNQKPDDGEDDTLTSLNGQGGMSRRMRGMEMPTFHITRALADRMLAAGGQQSLDELQAQLDTDDPKPCSAALAGVTVKGRAELTPAKAPCKNVVGLIRGEGPNADEYVVIGGHYDHMGNSVPMSMFGRREEAEPQIHNGADDNASGISGVIELGRALTKERLNRSVVLIAFSAEELGLHGSRHYVANPPFPLEQTVACLNMDMIGRMDESKNELMLFGTGTGDAFGRLIEQASRATGLELDASEAGSGRSDEASFQRKNIPGLHFFTGVHEDYHQPTDDTELINEAGGAKILSFIHEIALGVIQSETRLAWREVEGVANLGGRQASNRPRMGFRPDISGDGVEGIAVADVIDGGPAASAGMKQGDNIQRIGDTDVKELQDLRRALRGKSPGDEVEVIVTRGDERVTLNLKLGSG